jgi:hypothetical protein
MKVIASWGKHSSILFSGMMIDQQSLRFYNEAITIY